MFYAKITNQELEESFIIEISTQDVCINIIDLLKKETRHNDWEFVLINPLYNEYISILLKAQCALLALVKTATDDIKKIYYAAMHDIERIMLSNFE